MHTVESGKAERFVLRHGIQIHIQHSHIINSSYDISRQENPVQSPSPLQPQPGTEYRCNSCQTAQKKYLKGTR